jgi:hypothetical protein
MPLTAEDISNAVRIHFSYKKNKLWKNEKTYKKTKSGDYIAVKDLGYPSGFPDLMGYQVGKVAIVVGVEVKTENDTVKNKQTKEMNMMVKDGCIVYTAKENKDGNIDLMNWKNKEVEVILV